MELFGSNMRLLSTFDIKKTHIKYIKKSNNQRSDRFSVSCHLLSCDRLHNYFRKHCQQCSYMVSKAKFKRGFQNKASCSQFYDNINEHIAVNVGFFKQWHECIRGYLRGRK